MVSYLWDPKTPFESILVTPPNIFNTWALMEHRFSEAHSQKEDHNVGSYLWGGHMN